MRITSLPSLLNPALIFGESPEFLLYFHKPRAARLVGQPGVSEVSVPRSRPVVRPSDPTRPAGARGFSGDPAARSAPLGARRKLGWNPLAPAGRVGWALLHDGAASGNRHPGSKLDASSLLCLAARIVTRRYRVPKQVGPQFQDGLARTMRQVKADGWSGHTPMIAIPVQPLCAQLQ